MQVDEGSGWDNELDVAIPGDHPTPILWRVLVAPMRPRKVSKGGILIAEEAQRNQAHLNYVGKIVAMGALAWKHPRFDGEANTPKVGDFVVYGRYAGQQMEHRGVKMLLINDDEVLAVVRDPEALKIYI